MRILVTGSAGPAGRALAEQFRVLDHQVVGADMAPAADDAFEALEPVPAASDPGMLPTLLELVDRHRIELLIPTVADELPQVARAVADGAFDIPVVIGPAPAVAIAHDKLRTAQALAEAGVSVPRFGRPSAFSGTREALEHFGGSLIVKPRSARGGRGVRLVESVADLDWSALDDTQILQEFAAGTEYAPMVHAPSGADDDPVVVVVEKTELKDGRVGNAAAVRRRDDEGVADVRATAAAAVRAAGLTGPVDLDVRRLADGRPVVLEINARFGANSASAPEILDAVLRQAAAEG